MDAKFDVKNILPRNILTSSNTVHSCNYEIHEKFILANFTTKVTNQFPGIHGKRKHMQNLPRFLPLAETFRVIGVLQAEMSKGKNNGKIQFCNSEPEIIRCVLHWFKNFDIEEKDWSWRLTFNKKLKLRETSEETAQREFSARDFWIHEANLSLNSLAKTWARYAGTEEGKMKEDTPRWGTVIIEGGNAFLRALVVGLVNKVCKNLDGFSNNNISLYLDGFFSGEASFHRGKREILVPIKYDDERERVKKVMRRLNFVLDKDVPSRQIMSLRTGGMRDLFIAYRLNLFKMNPAKRIKLLENLLDIQRFPQDAKVFKNEIKFLQPQMKSEYDKTLKILNHKRKIFSEASKTGFKKYS